MWAAAWGPYHAHDVDAAPYAEVLRHFARRYPYRTLEAELGVSREVLRQVVNGTRPRIRPQTAARLRAGLLDERWYHHETARDH